MDPALNLDVLDPDAGLPSDVAPLSDGRMLVAGRFIYVDGDPTGPVVRLNADQSLDTSFGPVDVDGPIMKVAVTNDGRIYIAGGFRTINGVARAGVARLLADGALDNTFVPAVGSDNVQALAVTSDGGIYFCWMDHSDTEGPLVKIDRMTTTGARHSGFAPIVHPGHIVTAFAIGPGDTIVLQSLSSGSNPFSEALRRYRADGARDTTLQPPDTYPVSVQTIHVNSDGSIILGGYPINYGRVLARLFPDGGLDPAFGGYAPYQLSGITGIRRLSDGRFVVSASGFNPAPPTLLRFSATGEHDSSFVTDSLALQAGSSLHLLANGNFAVLGFLADNDGNVGFQLVQFSPTGSLLSFSPPEFLGQGVVNSFLPFSDQSMLVGGSFTRLGIHARGNVARFRMNGTIDESFPSADGTVNQISALIDGGALVLGDFPAIPGTSTPDFFRVGQDGSPHKSFLQSALFEEPGYFDWPPGMSHGVQMADGSIILAGQFLVFSPSSGMGYGGIIRVGPDGNIDETFQLNRSNTALGPTGRINALAVDAQQRLLLAGPPSAFQIQGISRPGIARTQANGVLDETFAPAVGITDSIGPIVPLTDGRFYLIGRRGDADPAAPLRLLRFEPDGTPDDTFNLAIPATEMVTAFSVRPDGSLLVASYLSGAAVNGGHVRRITNTGTVDGTFSATVSGTVTAMALDSQDRLWLGGYFTGINGVRRLGLARLAPAALFVAITGPVTVPVAAGASHTLTADVHGGSGTVSYQWKRDGSNIPGATSATLTVGPFSSAQAGYYTVSVVRGSSSSTSNPVQLMLPVAPVISIQPQGRQANVGGAIVLRVVASGTPEPAYQWFKDGVALQGATKSELRLRNLTAVDAGVYTVQVSNLGGTITSAATTLTIVPLSIDPRFTPAVVDQPAAALLYGGGAEDSVFVHTGSGIAINGEARTGLFQLAANGEVDRELNFGGRNFSSVKLRQADGTMYLLESQPSTGWIYLRRASPEGVVDPAFGPWFTGGYEIGKVGVDAAGRVVVGGSFRYVDGQLRPAPIRLLPDGTFDSSFQPGELSLSDLAVNPDGTVMTLIREGNQTVLRRLSADGSHDPAFPDVSIAAPHSVRIDRLPDGSYLLIGDFSEVAGQPRNRCARILSDGSLADNFAGASGDWNVLHHGIASDGSVRIVGQSTPDVHIVAFDSTGEVVFQRTYSFTSYNGAGIQAAIQSGGGVVLNGAFSEFSGRPTRGIVRVDPFGEVDPTYRTRIMQNGEVSHLHPLPGGRLLVSGRFTEIAGAARQAVAILGPDGRCDPNFVPELPRDSWAMRAWPLPDGRWLVNGYFPPFDSSFATLSTRLLRADGSLESPQPDVLQLSETRVLDVSREGKIYLERPAPNPPTFPTAQFTRLFPDFSPDPGFGVVVVPGLARFGMLADGKAFVATHFGEITDAAGEKREGLQRLLDDGRFDAGFTAPQGPYWPNHLPVEAADGRYYVHGTFTIVNGVERRGIARINHDGSLDSSFVPPSTGLVQNPEITQVAVQSDGRILVYGRYLQTSSPVGSSVLTRLNEDGSLDPSINLLTYTFNGHGLRTILPRPNGDIVLGGQFVNIGDELRISLARLTSRTFVVYPQRGRVEIPAGGTDYLELKVDGAVLPRYRWYKDGEPLDSDADRAVYALRQFTAEDEGLYSVEVTSSDGSIAMSEPIEVVMSNKVSIAPQTPLSFSETGGLGSIRIQAPPGTSWTVDGVPEWMSVMATPMNTGSRALTFELQPNATGAERSAQIEVAGRAFAIQQAASSGRLINISTRGYVGAGEAVMIVGFYTTGSGSLNFLGRGVGPTLANYGLSGVLQDPTIDLKRGQLTIGNNDDWDGGDDRDFILSESRRLFAFDLKEGAGDAALLTNLTADGYTAQIADPSGGEGIALAEFYDRTRVEEMNPYQRLVNISTRGWIGSGDQQLIAGFIIHGSTPKQVLIRGIGPGLGLHGVSSFLDDPHVRLVQGSATVAENDDWAFSPQAELLSAAFARSGAFALDPSSKDAALIVTLSPGEYTALVSGADGGEGVGLVEVYDLE